MFFNNAIKCSSQFIIVAERARGDIVGYVHYRFCWFRQKLNRPNTNGNGLQINTGIVASDANTTMVKSLAERILYIENVHCDEGFNCKLDCLTPLMLISLAVEHARQYAVYGVMDTSHESVDFFEHYFDMRVIATNQSQENNVTFMAVDLEGCSYRYAFLKKHHEIHLAGRISIEAVQDKNERMIVALPTLQNFSGSMDSSKSSSENLCMYKSDDIIHSISKEKKRKNIEIRVEVKKSEGKIERSLNGPPLDSIKNLKTGNDTDWEILRIFSKPCGKQNTDAAQPQTISVITELKELETQLSTTENNIMPSLWTLYKTSYNERKQFELESSVRSKTKSTLKQYQMLLERIKEEQRVWEEQQEQEENAVCDICHDGESTGENRIIFCDSCDVSVHQHCYGIEKVPKGDYFCHACLFFKRDKPDKDDTMDINGQQRKVDKKPPLPICCEVCPKPGGAFVETRIIPKSSRKRKMTQSSKWIHMVCAKWHGFNFVDRSSGELVEYGNIVEDISELKDHFRIIETKCCLCLGMRGCYHKCRDENCDKWMHVTCARSSGLCNVNHGSDHLGMVESEDAWSLTCPTHSILDPEIVPAGTAHLQALAKTFPLEPKPAPPPKTFYKLTKREREIHFANPEWEEEVMQIIMTKRNSSRCEICFQTYNSEMISADSTESGLMRCHICDSCVHVHCTTQKWKIEKLHSNKGLKITCVRCLYIESHKKERDFIEPDCHMCNDKHGTLVKAMAIPGSMKKWKANPSAYKKSLFGRQIWCHPICGM